MAVLQTVWSQIKSFYQANIWACSPQGPESFASHILKHRVSSQSAEGGELQDEGAHSSSAGDGGLSGVHPPQQVHRAIWHPCGGLESWEEHNIYKLTTLSIIMIKYYYDSNIALKEYFWIPVHIPFLYKHARLGLVHYIENSTSISKSFGCIHACFLGKYWPPYTIMKDAIFCPSTGILA